MSVNANALLVAGSVLLTLAAGAHAQVAVTPAPGNIYPRHEVERGAPEPVIRGCTQLELSADVERDACGTLTLAEVVGKLSEKTDDD